MKGEVYDYEGELLTQAEIARKEGINRSTLADWYKKTGNMVEAVAKAKKSLAQRNIKYYEETLSLKAIATKEKLKFESLKKFYDQTDDIYEAVKLAKEAKAKRNGSIPYNNQMMSILAIATLEEVDNHALGRYYEQTNDIHEAVRLAKIAKAKQNGTIFYNNQFMTISAIASLEQIKRDTLKEYYEIYGDINKAVFITKESQAKRKKALLRGKQASYEDLSQVLGVSVLRIEQMINSGYTPEQIEKSSKRGVPKEEQTQIEENSLYQFCLANSYNYWVINYLVRQYNKTPEEAIKTYLENGQQIPKNWIYEKYDVLFKHLMLCFGLDSNRIVKIMQDNNCDIRTSITKLVFLSNNDKVGFKKAEINWMLEVYDFIKDITLEEWAQAKTALYITDREINFLTEKGAIIDKINRQLLLFEFASVLDEWDIDELCEMMMLYEISEEEVDIIVVRLYMPFDNKVINPTDEYLNRQSFLSSIILNSDIGPEDILKRANFTDSEKKDIIRKKELLFKIKQLLLKKRNKEKVG